jgi:hypothetical protein
LALFLLREPDRSPLSVIFAVVFPPALFAPRLKATTRPMKLGQSISSQHNGCIVSRATE